MTLKEIQQSQKQTLIPADIAEIIGCSAMAISTQVKEDKRNGTNSFPFPTIRIGTRTYIPRIPFLKVMGGVSDE